MAENQYLTNIRRKVITSMPYEEDIEEENRYKAFEKYLRENHVDEDTITKLRPWRIDSLLDLMNDKASWWNDLSSTGKQKLQHLLDLENDYSRLYWDRPPKILHNKCKRSSRNRDHSQW
jgi:hypothetical protein